MKLKKLKEYRHEAFSASKSILKNKINILKFFMCEFLYILSSVLLLGSICRFVYYKMVKNVSKGYKNYSLQDSIKSLNNPKIVYKLILTTILKGIIYLAILLVLALILSPFVLLATTISTNTGNFVALIIAATLASVFSLIYLIYIIFFNIPVSQLFAENESLSISEALKLSFKAQFKSSKHQIVLSVLFEFVVRVVFIGLIVLFYILDMQGIYYISCLGVLILVLYIFFMPTLGLGFAVQRRNIRIDSISNFGHVESSEFSERIFKLVKKNEKKVKHKEEIISDFDNSSNNSNETQIDNSIIQEENELNNNKDIDITNENVNALEESLNLNNDANSDVDLNNIESNLNVSDELLDEQEVLEDRKETLDDKYQDETNDTDDLSSLDDILGKEESSFD